MGVVYDALLGEPLLHTHEWRGVLSSAPSSPKDGWRYINSTNHTLYVYYGAKWQVLHVLEPAVIESGNPIGLLLSLTYA